MSVLRIARWTGLSIGAALALCATLASAQQRPAAAAAPAAPPPLPPLFFREEWRQITPPANAGPDFVTEGGVTAAAVTNPALELKLYDPDAASIPGYRANPPPRSVARDWGGPSCIQLAGHNQNPPPQRVANGEPTDPRELVDRRLPRRRRRDVARPFALRRPHGAREDPLGDTHVGLPRRAPGREARRRQLVRRRLRRRRAVGELDVVSRVGVRRRVRALAAARHLARRDRGKRGRSPDLSRVDEVGFADLLPGSGHGWGGFVNVGRIEVYGKPVAR